MDREDILINLTRVNQFLSLKHTIKSVDLVSYSGGLLVLLMQGIEPHFFLKIRKNFYLFALQELNNFANVIASVFFWRDFANANSGAFLDMVIEARFIRNFFICAIGEHAPQQP